MTESGDLLTPDEQLIRHERWSETRDLPTALFNLLALHHAYEGEVWDSEDARALVDALVVMIGQLSQGNNTKG